MGDAPLLDDVDLPIAFNPSSTLANYSRALGWTQVTEVKDNIIVLEQREDTTYSLSSVDHLLATARKLAQ